MHDQVEDTVPQQPWPTDAANGYHPLSAEAPALQVHTLPHSDNWDYAQPYGKVRCHWLILDGNLKFRFIDHSLAYHLSTEASGLVGTDLFDYIHPDEYANAKTDFRPFLDKRSIFGTVTRCRYSRVTRIRKLLGAVNPSDSEIARAYALDNEFLLINIVANWIGDNMVLCFFHAAEDLDPVADANEKNLSDWSNWCGSHIPDPATNYLPPYICDELARVMAALQPSAYDGSANPPLPNYVFQISDSNTGAVIFTWPPPIETFHIDSKACFDYSAEEYARLVLDAKYRQQAPDTATTSCTRRVSSNHSMQKYGVQSSFESVVVTYGTITFACFQHHPVKAEAAPQSWNLGVNGHEMGMQAHSPLIEHPTMHSPLIEQHSATHSPLLEHPSQMSRPQPRHALPHWQQARHTDGPNLSPSVAHAGAILGSFSGYHTDSHHSPMLPPLPSPLDLQHAMPFSYSQYNNSFDPYSNGNRFDHHLNRPSPSTSNYSPHGLPTPTFGLRPPSQSPPPDSAVSQHSRKSASRSPKPPMVKGAAASAANTTGVKVPKPRKRKSNADEANRPVACAACGSTESPEWRKGPDGSKSLCNACGLRFARQSKRQRMQAEAAAGKLASPTNGPLSSEPRD